MLADLDPAMNEAIKLAVQAASGGGTSMYVQYGSFGVIVMVIIWVLRVGWPAHRQDMKDSQAQYVLSIKELGSTIAVELSKQREHDAEQTRRVSTDVQNNTLALNTLIKGGCAAGKDRDA